jgi:hypothetical protein
LLEAKQLMREARLRRSMIGFALSKCRAKGGQWRPDLRDQEGHERH